MCGLGSEWEKCFSTHIPRFFSTGIVQGYKPCSVSKYYFKIPESKNLDWGRITEENRGKTAVIVLADDRMYLGISNPKISIDDIVGEEDRSKTCTKIKDFLWYGASIAQKEHIISAIKKAKDKLSKLSETAMYKINIVPEKKPKTITIRVV